MEERRAEAPPAKAAAPAASPLLEGYAALLRARGGAGGAANLYAAGGDGVDATVVDAEATGRAALALLAELRERATATAAAAPREAVAVAPPDLWAPEAVLARAQAAQLRE